MIYSSISLLSFHTKQVHDLRQDKKPRTSRVPKRGTPDKQRPSLWSPTRKFSDASDRSMTRSLSPIPHSWSPRRSSTPGMAAKFEVPLEDVILPLGQPATYVTFTTYTSPPFVHQDIIYCTLLAVQLTHPLITHTLRKITPKREHLRINPRLLSAYRLDAKVSGYPLPKVTWYKNGEVIRWSPDCQISYDISGIATLTIQRTELDDFGFYVCEAKNAYGVDMTECELVQLGEYII